VPLLLVLQLLTATAAAVLVCRDMSVDEAVELGRRSIYHATFRDCASGGTVSGEWGLHSSSPEVAATHELHWKHSQP
jgi:20S proteasome alpha/beta subunit